MLGVDTMMRGRDMRDYGGTLGAPQVQMGMYQTQFSGAPASANGFFASGPPTFGTIHGNAAAMGHQYPAVSNPGYALDGSTMSNFGAHMTMASGNFVGHHSPEQQSGQVIENQVPEDSRDLDDPPITPPPARERFSYTRYQLELLNAIFEKVRYPNSIQKQLIAKRVGITRDQVKIWFQNRRRRDVVANQRAADGLPPIEAPRSNSPEVQMVPPGVMSGVLTELLKYDGDYKKQLKLKAARAKANGKNADNRAKPYDISRSSHNRNMTTYSIDTSPQPPASVSSQGSPSCDVNATSCNRSPTSNYSIPVDSDLFAVGSPEGFTSSLSSTFSSTPSSGGPSRQSSPPIGYAMPATSSTPSSTCYAGPPSQSVTSTSPISGANHSMNSYHTSPNGTHNSSANSQYASPPSAIARGGNQPPNFERLSPASSNDQRLSGDFSHPVEPETTNCGPPVASNQQDQSSQPALIPSNEQLDMIAPPNAVAPQFGLLPFSLSALESPKKKSPLNRSSHSDEGQSSPTQMPSSSSPQSLSVSIPTDSGAMSMAQTMHNWHMPAPRGMSEEELQRMNAGYPIHHQLYSMPPFPPNQTIPPNFHGLGGLADATGRGYGGGDGKMGLDRVFPFPLMAEQAMRLTSVPPYTPEGYGSAFKTAPSGSYRDHYQPLLITPYANPYYGQEMSKMGQNTKPYQTL